MRALRIIISIMVLLVLGVTYSSSQEKASNPLYQPDQPSKNEGVPFFAKAKALARHEIYSSIEKKVNNRAFTEGYPIGKIIGTVQPGDTIELLKVFENGTESKYTYKIKTAKGTTGYILPRGFNITEVVGDKGAILSVHLSRPYEFEGNIQAVDEMIGKYEKFIKDYPDSEFVPEAVVNIVGLNLYASRTDKVIMLLNKLYANTKISDNAKTAVNELIKYISEYQNEIIGKKIDYKIYDEVIRRQNVLFALVPSSLSLGRNEIN
jgi:hypothetical protein